MGHRFLDHTADIAVELEASTLEALFQEAQIAFTEALTQPDLIAERTVRPFDLTASAPDLLLVDWLTELNYAFETEGLLVRRTSITLEKSPNSIHLTAEAWGEPRTDRHPIKVLIKAVTYHGLEVARTSDGWRARVVFDI